MTTSERSAAALKMGQVWQLGDSRIEVGFVGRTLVHYRQVKGTMPRPATQLSSQLSLEKELKAGKAVLLDEAASRPPAGVLRIMKSRSTK